MLEALRSRPALLAAIVVGFSADLLFYGKPLGLSLLVFVLIFIGALIFAGQKAEVTAIRQNLWLLLPLLFFAGMVAIRDNGFLTGLNVLAVAGLLAYLLLYYAAGRVGEAGLMTTAVLPFYTAGKSLILAAPVVGEAAKRGQIFRRRRNKVMPVVRGGLLAMPLLFVFTILLASADLIFADQLAYLFNFINIGNLFRLAFRGWIIFGISWAVTGGLVLALDRKDEAADVDGAFARLGRFRFLGFTESTTLLILINLLFFSFVLVQFRYLFGGQFNVSLSGFTYAEYARRGFFELLVVALLSLGLILGVEAVTWRESKRQFKLFNLLSSFMIILVIIMLVSAFRRMRLYEAAYGYTELRLTVYVFMIWLGLFLIWFLVGLWRRPDRFGLGALVVVMGFLATLNLVNPDAFIVRQNMARYWAGGNLDTAYLERLSADAVPALVEALAAAEGVEGGANCPAHVTTWATDHARSGDKSLCPAEVSKTLRQGLLDRLQELEESSARRPWQSFQLSQWRAERLLAQELGG